MAGLGLSAILCGTAGPLEVRPLGWGWGGLVVPYHALLFNDNMVAPLKHSGVGVCLCVCVCVCLCVHFIMRVHVCACICSPACVSGCVYLCVFVCAYLWVWVPALVCL